MDMTLLLFFSFVYGRGYNEMSVGHSEKASLHPNRGNKLAGKTDASRRERERERVSGQMPFNTATNYFFFVFWIFGSSRSLSLSDCFDFSGHTPHLRKVRFLVKNKISNRKHQKKKKMGSPQETPKKQRKAYKRKVTAFACFSSSLSQSLKCCCCFYFVVFVVSFCGVCKIVGYSLVGEYTAFNRTHGKFCFVLDIHWVLMYLRNENLICFRYESQNNFGWIKMERIYLYVICILFCLGNLNY